jgi:hypothetical protein
MTAVVSHLEIGTAYSPLEYSSETVTFLPVGITRSIGDVVLPILGSGYLVSLVVATVLLRRVASWRDLAPTLALVLTQALWFSLPFSVHYWHWQTGLEPIDAQGKISNYLMMIFIGHGLQYLWITTYYARASGHWRGYANYWAKAAASGFAIWTLPAVLIDPTGFLSGPRPRRRTVRDHRDVRQPAPLRARRRDLEAAQHAHRRVLLRSVPDVETPHGAALAVAAPARVVRRSSADRGASGFVLTQFYVPSAIARGDLDRAESGVRSARWLGNDDPRCASGSSSSSRSAAISRARRARRAPRRAARRRPDLPLLGEVSSRATTRAAQAAFETAVGRKRRGPTACTSRSQGSRCSAATTPAAEHYYTALRLTEVRGDRERSRMAARHLVGPAVRNAEVAVAAAEQLAKVDEKPHHLDTLAAAYAAGGRFDDAVRTAARAAELAEHGEDAAQLAGIRRNLDRYRARLTAAR